MSYIADPNLFFTGYFSIILSFFGDFIAEIDKFPY